jgi:hypothetical protein
MIATNACSTETSHAIIDSGASCCVTPQIEDFINQPTPIQNTTLKGIAGGITALGRGTIQLKIQQENQEHIIKNMQTPWTGCLETTDTPTMTHSAMNTHIYSPTGEQTFTQIT